MTCIFEKKTYTQHCASRCVNLQIAVNNINSRVVRNLYLNEFISGPLAQVSEEDKSEVLLRNDQLTKKAVQKEKGKRKTGKGKTDKSKKGKECETKKETKKTKKTKKTSETKETNGDECETKKKKGVKKGGKGEKVKREKKGWPLQGSQGSQPKEKNPYECQCVSSPSKSKPKDVPAVEVGIESAVPPKPKRSKKADAQVEENTKAKSRKGSKPLKALKDTPKQSLPSSGSKDPGPKAKARGRKPRKSSGTDPLDNEVLTGELVAFANLFDPEKHWVTDDNFKVLLRGKVAVSPECGFRLNIYWSRCACGVTSKEEKKDLHNFSFNGSAAADVHRLAVAVKCAELTAT